MVGGLNFEALPPGFRFHPTDKELIIHYLCNQATFKLYPVSIILEVDIYKFDPWELPDAEKIEFGENEWYFFSPRDKKYLNGVRPNRATVSGYWKATGTGKPIYSGSKHVGVKKALVFYKGRPPKGLKTDWIMHEYTLAGLRRQVNRPITSMRLDNWVLCRIYKKKQVGKALEQKEDNSITKINVATAEGDTEQKLMKFPKTFSINHMSDMDYLGPVSHLLCDGSYDSTFDFQMNTAGIDPFVNKPHQLVEMRDHSATDSHTFQVKPRSSNQQYL